MGELRRCGKSSQVLFYSSTHTCRRPRQGARRLVIVSALVADRGARIVPRGSMSTVPVGVSGADSCSYAVFLAGRFPDSAGICLQYH